MRAIASSIALLCVCLGASQVIAVGLMDPINVFSESSTQQGDLEKIFEELEEPRLEPARVAQILSEIPIRDRIGYGSNANTIASFLHCNHVRLATCDKRSLKKRINFFEGVKATDQSSRRPANLRVYCRAAFEGEVLECLKAAETLVENKINDWEYLKGLYGALVETANGHLNNGETFDGALLKRRSTLEKFVVDNCKTPGCPGARINPFF